MRSITSRVGLRFLYTPIAQPAEVLGFTCRGHLSLPVVGAPIT